VARDVVRDGANVSKDDMPGFLHDKQMDRLYDKPNAENWKTVDNDTKDVDMSDKAVQEAADKQRQRMADMIEKQRQNRDWMDVD
jgi:hypothetical protein